MSLPASGTISLGQVQGEFGGGSPAGLSEYYKGGSYVAVGDTAPNVPTSGTISLNNFHGAAKSGGSAFSASGPGSVDGAGDGDSTQRIDTTPATVTASGGTAPYFYSWSLYSGSGWSIAGGSTATATFTSPLCPVGEERTATFKCHVTDSASHAVDVYVDAAVFN